jgi:hypothetical protein
MSTTTRRASSGYITAELTAPDDLIAQYRANVIALRKLTATTGSHAATMHAISRRETEQYSVETDAHLNGTHDQHQLLCALVDERILTGRIRKAQALGQERPELTFRLNACRATIRRTARAIKAEVSL